MNQSTTIIKEYIGTRNVLLDFLYTIIISILIAAFLSISGISPPFFYNLVLSQSFGISICSIVLVLIWLLKPEKLLSYVFIFTIGVTGGTLMGIQIGPFVLQNFFSIPVHQPRGSLIQKIIIAITFGSVISYFFFIKARFKANLEEIQQERISRLSKEKEALEANLRLLQAQIEPHFLFNTLSNILSLIDTDPPKGKLMLMDLIQYLRNSLSRTRHEMIPLDQEMELIRAYLNILKIRMGERLNFSIDLSESLREYPFPPMLIQPLVENAVKHGLDPKIEGGTIVIKAAEGEGLIRIEVVDSGVGFTAYFEPGVGMGNVRERLNLLYGNEGRLVIEENQPTGVRAVIEVPKQEEPFSGV
jgi:sensor histidine kinase YesM